MTAASYSVHPTPIGEALIVVTDEGLATLQILDSPEAPDDARGAAAGRAAAVRAEAVRTAVLSEALAGVGLALGAVLVDDPARGAEVARQLDEYFAGTRRDFDLALDERLVAGFTLRALRAVREIPYGETASYSEVAIAAGSPRAHRAVGTACAQTPWSVVVPAHRVVRADGSIGEYGGHPERKRFLLDLEHTVSGAAQG